MKTASLINSKRLFELMPGIKTEFVRATTFKKTKPEVRPSCENSEGEELWWWKFICPAPTADEIWEILPVKIKDIYWLSTVKLHKNTAVAYETPEGEPLPMNLQKADNLPDALALMLIYLVENGFLG